VRRTGRLPISPTENGTPTLLAGPPHGLWFVEAVTNLDKAARQSRDLGCVGG
jgi:hypothetical protein